MKRSAIAVWNGTGLEGKGSLQSLSGALHNLPYSFAARFKDESGQSGTNPEELIAAAHAGCFAMALSFKLAGAGFPADELRAEAVLHMVNEGGWSVSGISLHVEGRVPGISEELFLSLAADAKANCPISKMLRPDISLEAKLIS